MKPFDEAIVMRKPTIDDGAALHMLVQQCAPLEQNSTYCHLLLCTHFANTCVVAEKHGRLVGFVSGYRKPESWNVYFLWQVGVVPEERGRGLARRLIETILERVEARGVTELQTTVTRSNEPSRALFRSLARQEGADMTEHEMFMERHFGDRDHEAEYLFRIRPLRTPPL